MKSTQAILTIVLASAAGVHSLSADVLLSTGFNTTGSTSASDNIGYAISNVAQATQQVALSGAGSNNPSPAGFWTVADSAKVDLAGIAQVSDGTSAWGHASTATDQIKKGAFWVTAPTFSALAADTTQIRAAGAASNWVSLQLNSATLHSATFNLVFEIKAGQSYDNWSSGFKVGTAGTNGVWNANTAAQNGNYNVSIFELDANGIMGSSFNFFDSAQAVGAGAGVSVNAIASNAAKILTGGANGTKYLFQIDLTDKTQTQRFTLDDFSLSATPYSVVPEPTSALAGLLIGAGLLRRRRA